MRRWVPLAFGGVVVFAYVFFYLLTALEGQGADSFSLANLVGMAVVFVGVVAAGVVLRRAAPPR